MHRRHFLTRSLAATAVTVAHGAAEPLAAPVADAREYYQLRRYQLQSGPQQRLTESYFSDALLPALGRLGMEPVGAFRLEYGPETPAYYLLITARSLQDLVMVDARLGQDAAFLHAAEPFWNAPATAPAFLRVESSLMVAFSGWPRLIPPATSTGQSKRILQLRTYESPSDQDHVRKVEMFHKGEFEIFQKAGCHPVFFGDTLVGPRLPNLTYMLSFAGMAELESAWAKFRDDPDWKKLSASPRYNYEAIVSNITNLVLSPLACSQV